MRIVIDPGHGLTRDGNWQRPEMTHELTGKTYREDLGTLEIAKEMALVLQGDHEVFLTREDERNAECYLLEKYPSKWKAKHWRDKSHKWVRWFTKKKKADLFISIHTNATKEPNAASGPICFYAHKNSKPFARRLSRRISEIYGLPNRGIRKRRFLILRRDKEQTSALKSSRKQVSVLFEAMFHTHQKDLGYLVYDNGKSIGSKLGYIVSNYLLDHEDKKEVDNDITRNSTKDSRENRQEKGIRQVSDTSFLPRVSRLLSRRKIRL